MGGITRRTLLGVHDIADSSITGSKVLDHTLGSQDIGTSEAIIVEGTQIEDDLIGSVHLGDGAVAYATQIKDDVIGSEHLEAAAVSYATQLKDDVITGAKILDHTLGSQHLGTSEAIIVEGTQIEDDLIGSVHLGDGAVAYATQIKDDVIGSEHLEAAAVSYATQLKDDVITGAKILDHTLGSQHLGTSEAIIVEGTQIEDDLIGSAHLGNAAVSYAAQVKDAAVTMAKLSLLSEFGTLGGVTKTGTYLHFDTAFGAVPTIVLTSIGGGPGTVAELVAAPAAGSAHLRLTGSGTIVVEYLAWGTRA